MSRSLPRRCTSSWHRSLPNGVTRLPWPRPAWIPPARLCFWVPPASAKPWRHAGLPASWPASGVLLAATNHPDLLDPAIWRLFEMHLSFPLPDQQAIARFIDSSLTPHFPAVREWSELLTIACEGRSFSDIERAFLTARRIAALGQSTLEEQQAGLVTGTATGKAGRIQLATALVERGLMSQRKARTLTGVARDTIRSHAAPKKKSRHKESAGV